MFKSFKFNIKDFQRYDNSVRIGLCQDKCNILTEQDWVDISLCGDLSEEFINIFSDRLNWTALSEKVNMSEEFMEKHWNKLNKLNISMSQNLSEDFIEKHLNDLNIPCLVFYQKLSFDFLNRHICEFSKRIGLDNIYGKQDHLTEEQKKELREKLFGNNKKLGF